MCVKKKIRLFGLLSIPACLLFVWACIQRPMKVPVPDQITVEQFLMPQSAERDVDILFMVDNSGSMKNEQVNLQRNFLTLMQTLAQMPGGLPNVHIGVITSDLGAGHHTGLDRCQLGGDKGVLGQSQAMEHFDVFPVENRVADRGSHCIGPGQRYIVDIEPVGCTIKKSEDNSCPSHSCEQADCLEAAANDEDLVLHIDKNGCPRCRNYSGELSDVFSCYADVGIHGCGFEQQLEAVKKSLAPETLENKGFLRKSGFLAVVLITDEDDCSASDPNYLFDPNTSNDRIDSELGYIHSYRCFEFGVTCDTNDRTITGPRQGCVPRNDENALLHDIGHFTGFLEALKSPVMPIVAAITGPVPDQIMVQRDDKNRPELKYSCLDPADPDQGADPAVRIKAFVDHFNLKPDMDEWAFTSVCSEDFSSALEGIARKIVDEMSEKCPAQPFEGCRDGPPGTECSPCLPRCTIYDIERRNSLEEQKMEVVWCGRVCKDGLCTQADMVECDLNENGNCLCPEGLAPTTFGPDREVYCAPLLYHDSPPDVRRDDRLLSVIPRQECNTEGCIGRSSACWYMSANTPCEFGAGLRIVRGEDPPPNTFADGRCNLIPTTETLCNDGVDNDQDCLTDHEDPDCQ